MGPILVSGTSGFIGGLLASRLGDMHIPFDPRKPLDFSFLPKEEISTIVHLGGPSNRVPGAEREIIDAAKKIFSRISRTMCARLKSNRPRKWNRR